MSTSTTQAPTPGQPIPTPPDFPVHWDNPNDASLTWMMASVFYKAPIPPLIFSVCNAFVLGGNIGLANAGLSFETRLKRINTIAYLGLSPKGKPSQAVVKAMEFINRASPEEADGMIRNFDTGLSNQQEVILNPVMERLDTYWNEEILPEVKQHLAYFESSNLRGMSLGQLGTLLAEVLLRTQRMIVLHNDIVLPVLYAMSQFEDLYCELFEGATTLDALQLTQGFENMTMEGDRALWYLSRTARSNPEIHSILSEKTSGEAITALENISAGKSFLTDLHTWLAQYGQRLNFLLDLSHPSWIEDPTPVIQNLQAYIAMPDLPPEKEPAALAAEREKAVSEARARLNGYPKPVVAQFETLLKAAQAATVIHEDHNVWIDQRFFYHIRLICIEIGARLAQARIIETADDVFCLTADELQNAVNVPMKGLVLERKKEMEHFSRVIPPPMLGTMPGGEMAEIGPMDRALFKGELGSANTINSEMNKVTGLPGSAGVARGTVRVIHSLAEAVKLQPGDVLVTVATEPPWTPLFATASAIVTNSGGVLSHSAVVAREYRIPAVVGTGNATTIFKDGQMIEVDGNTGIVRLVVEEQDHEFALAG